MSALRHIAIAAAYTLLAAAVAVGLPLAFPALDPIAAIVIGGIILMGSALMHEVFLRQEGEARMAGLVARLENENKTIRRHFDDAIVEMTALRDSLQHVSRKSASEEAGRKQDVDSVIAEVKVLQSLVQQFSSGEMQMPVAAAGGARPQIVANPQDVESTGEEDDRAPSPISVVVEDGALVGQEITAPRSDDDILKNLCDGLESNRVDLLLQPIVRLPQRKRAYYEAFTRIRDKDDQVMAPNEYIGIAEREGLVAAIDNFMLFRCVQLVRKTQASSRNIGFFCNISAHSLMDRHFLSNFVEFMSDNRALAPDLIFEFPHATIANRDEEVEDHLRQLAAMGFRFSVDQVPSLNIDYGDLAGLRFKFIKLNAETMLDEVRNPSGPIAVEDIKRLIDRHGMDLVVEKIETEADLLELLDLRIDFGQGYLFGSPKLSSQE